ncbi:kynureninase [Sanghuangporus baumii]|uniref:Kynureninase n=1 Tax=Sanghuangporus baumii TaxID=108892 RepID=A0A9Q5MXU1_SANBA|nr:kynureninase [Sanghuangporus baumii]
MSSSSPSERDPFVAGVEAAQQRAEFALPTNRAVGGSKVALDKRALPKRAQKIVHEEINVWATRAVEGHFDHPFERPWVSITDHVNPLLAELVGAKENEVACMGSLTSNLHLLMNTFYKPTAIRYKILCETKAFPSDWYAFTSQAEVHGLDPATAILEISPRPGEYTLRKEDILSVIAREGHEIALVLFSGVQYYTGQYFPMEDITRAAKQKGCICGWDLAHAVGNVPVQLHDWDVDFAVWCSYKYLNAGPGAIAGLFIHEKWADVEKPRLAGWWGHDPNTRFAMPPLFSPIRGAQGFQQSNPDVLSVAALLGSLQVFRQAGMMPALRRRSLHLTGRLMDLLMKSKWYVQPQDVRRRYGAQAEASLEGKDETPKGRADSDNGGNGKSLGFTIITPLDPEARGAQLSLGILPPGKGLMQHVSEGLKSHGVIGDERKPDVIRLSPAPLYNTIEDCEQAAQALDYVFDDLDSEKTGAKMHPV